MPSDKASYLAARYLTADPKPSSAAKKHKKRKRGATANDGLLIKDEDDDDAWSGRGAHSYDDPLDPATDGPVTAGTSAEFRKAKKSAWKSVGGGGGGSGNAQETRADADAAAAEAIVASAAADRLAEGRDPDDLDDPDDPMDVDDDAAAPSSTNKKAPAGEEGDVVKMSDGTHGGLQSAAALSAQLERRRREERAMQEQLAALQKEAKAKKKRSKGDGIKGEDGQGGEGEPELVLRDATGRRVDLSLRRAELRRAAAEAERAEAARQRMLTGGQVQEEEARARRELLEAAKLMTVARGADDEEMNAEMRAQRRWNDPMAEFLGAEDDGGGGRGGETNRQGSQGGGKNGKDDRRRPTYKGAAPPNRYGIRPGYRWDGVDRGNGFEAERFRAINRVERAKGLEYAWQMDT